MKDKNRHYVDAHSFNSYTYGFNIKNAQRLGIQFRSPVNWDSLKWIRLLLRITK